MPKRNIAILINSFLVIAILSGCSTFPFASPTPTATPEPTQTPLPTRTPTPAPTPTATPVPYFVPAQVWSGILQVPILIYHRFANDTRNEDSTHAPYSVFKEQLQKLYDAGFSLVSISSWLNGTFVVPAGRKPLIMTIDDGLSADQLYINEDGTPSEYSGIGILWQFAKDHPNFGFAISIYVNMGDKYYGDLHVDDWFYVSDGDAWKEKLANTIVWALENGVEIENHTYTHAMLSLTDPQGIHYQLQQNDVVIRDFLARVNRSDLDAKVGNVIALPYGEWPSTQSGIKVIKDYKNPEGLPVQAILEAYNLSEAEFTPSVFSDGYNAFNLPRITATTAMVDLVVSKNDEIPTIGSCQLGPTHEENAADAATLQALITTAVQAQSCPEGIYHVSGLIFVAKDGTVTQYPTQ